MTYVVTSPKKETLKSGRMVFPGQEIPDREAEPNTRLIERGALTLQQEQEETPAPAPKPSPPEPPEGEKQESPAPAPEAARPTSSRSSRRTKAPAGSSVPQKEDDPK